MGFLKQLGEKLEAQQVFDSLKGKYETRFKVEGNEYAFLANTIAGDCDDNAQWMLEFENIKSHRIGVGDGDPKVVKAFAEAVDQWVKERNPHCFYTYGSHIESINSIIEAVKKKVKKYNLIDDTADKKNEENGEVIEGNIVGKITWTKMVEQEVTSHDDIGSVKSDEFEKTYEEPKDIKPTKSYMSGTSKSDKLDKNDGSYDLKTESFTEFKSGKLDDKEYIEEALKADELIKKSKSTLKKFKDKFAEPFKKAIEVASDPESFKKWMDNNKEDFLTAFELVKHMVDKKEISFEQEIFNGIHLSEGFLDIFSKKTPNALIAAAIILMATGGGNRTFAGNKAEDAFRKAKENSEKVVEIVKKESGDAVNKIKELGSDAKDKATKEVEKNIDIVKKNIPSMDSVGDEVKNKTDDAVGKIKEFGSDVKDKATKEVEKNIDIVKKNIPSMDNVGDKVKNKTDDVKQGFKNFIQKKNVERDKEIPVRPKPKTQPTKRPFDLMEV